MVSYPTDSEYFRTLTRRIKRGIKGHLHLGMDEFVIEDWDRSELNELINFINALDYEDDEIHIGKIDWPDLYNWAGKMEKDGQQ